MPELTHVNHSVEFWSRDVSSNQLQEFWNEMSQQARQKLLRIDKQTLSEKARNNMFCSRCYGFLLEEFSQIAMYGNPSQQERDVGHLSCNRTAITKFQNVDGLSNADAGQCDNQDPSIHPWGCLTTTRDGAVTLLDCYLFSTSFQRIQNVFDNARARERERKLINPNACGVGGRRWKGPGTRESCAVHTARSPLEKLVDFWSSLGRETRQSLLKMKEEDFMERLVYRFDRKNFCKDCRKNVVREFKELKELMRIRKEPGFQCQISNDTVQADWSHTFIDSYGTYHHFEWGIGSEKGKSDISAFKNVGLSGIVQVNGLDLMGLDACYVTLRAWKTDGDCTEISVKAHTLKGQQCIHRRLLVGDGVVTITEGESLRDFFKHAEEVEKEDDDLRLDGECSRTQKHAKSPELARKFLLDGAIVIFKEQVEKAFRERTARQNAHSVFVSLALKLLEERAHVACKEILTLEKQMKLLEEEVKEKNEEEERKERRRIKEREKKLRRKARTSRNEIDRDDCSLTNQHLAPKVRIEESTVDDEMSDTSEIGKDTSSRHVTPNIQDERVSKTMHYLSNVCPDENLVISKDKNGSSGFEYIKYSEKKLKNRYQEDKTLKCSSNRTPAVVYGSGIMVDKSEQSYHDNSFDGPSRTIGGLNEHSRSSAAKSIIRSSGPTLQKKVHCSNRMSERGNLQAHSCYQHSDYRRKVDSCCMTTQAGQEYVCKPHSASLDISKISNFGNKLPLGNYITDSRGRPKFNFFADNIPSCRRLPHSKQVKEPMELKKYNQSYLESDVTVRSSTLSGDAMEPYESLESTGALGNDVGGQKTVCIKGEVDVKKELKLCKLEMENNSASGFHLDEPSSTLNLDDVNQQPKEREASRFLQIGVHKFEVVLDKKQAANGSEPIRSCSVDRSRIYVPAKVPKENVNGNPDINHMSLQAQGIDLALHSHSMQRDIPTKQGPLQTQPNASVDKNLNFDISQANNKSFSLFHFGDPFALADAYKSDSLLLEDAVEGLSLTKCINHNEGDLTCNTKDSIQEYNLFASCKGITFSIF